ncbi:hypothetical protein, partial [Klebsiella pneumoniae]
PVVGPSGARAASALIDDAEIEADLQTDSEFVVAMQTLPTALDEARDAFIGGGASVRDTPFSQAVSTQVAGVEGGRGLIVWFKV